jgi:SAM-dependent methyltransferase
MGRGLDSDWETLRSTYDRRAELAYAEPASAPDFSLHWKFKHVVDALAPYLPCDSFLDAGCGDGRHLAYLARREDRPRRLVGADLSERILETARAACAEPAPDVELRQANLERLPFADGEFDVVLSTQVIEHLLDVQAGVDELARVLRPGGALVLTTDNTFTASRVLNAPRSAAVAALGLRARRAGVTFPHRSFRVGEVHAHLRAAGLDVRKTSTFRFHVDGIGSPRVQRVLNRVDDLLPPHPFGDIVLVVAAKPAD